MLCFVAFGHKRGRQKRPFWAQKTHRFRVKMAIWQMALTWGPQRERFRLVDMVFLVFIGLLYLPLSGPVLRDTARLSQRYPPIARYGGFGVSTWPIACDTPSPFSEHFPPWRACKVEVRYPTPPPPSKGVSQRYLRDTLWKQGKWVRYPPLWYYLESVLRDRGGILHWAAKIYHRPGKFFFEARKVPQMIFFWWWSCTLSSCLTSSCFVLMK